MGEPQSELAFFFAFFHEKKYFLIGGIQNDDVTIFYGHENIDIGAGWVGTMRRHGWIFFLFVVFSVTR